MEKDAFYFPHFSNARNDKKLKRARKELGIEGYGIFFMLLEVLREESGFKYPMVDIDLLADDFNTSEQKIRTVIANYDLFQVDEEQMFFSSKFIEFLQPYIVMKEQRRIAGLKSGEARRNKSLNLLTDERELNGCSTDVQRELNENEQSKGNKVKETKENKIIPPPLIIVSNYCSQRKNGIDAQKFIDYYEARAWQFKTGQKMKDWQAAVRTWEKNTKDDKKPMSREERLSL